MVLLPAIQLVQGYIGVCSLNRMVPSHLNLNYYQLDFLVIYKVYYRTGNFDVPDRTLAFGQTVWKLIGDEELGVGFADWDFFLELTKFFNSEKSLVVH